ncbi:MAG TPA: dihydrolipoamide acetyltransferase family protein [Bacteroidales bacterium]|nr:dihydrolipoamide acetyltransferase family protein [Bacteroidales bacterium]
MAIYEFTLPAMGEGIIEAAITRWFVTGGQQVKIDQPLVEVATDKVDSEIPSPVEGTVVKLVYNEGEIPKVGEVLALVETDMAVPPPSSPKADLPEMINKEFRKLIPERGKSYTWNGIKITDKSPEAAGPYISPLIRTLARQRGITPEELGQISGTGLEGRITREDIIKYMIDGKPFAGSSVTEEFQAVQSLPVPEFFPEEGDEVVEMDRMRKIIAGHMIRSKRTAAHVTSFLEADITAMVSWRERIKSTFLTRELVKLTFTPLFVEAVAMALKEFPRINISVAGENMILRKNINIGIATALPGGNLIVPVIRNADRENLGSLSRKIADLAERARKGELLPVEIKGGTFTITNIGQYNNLTGTPIINQPEAAILAVGTISKKPWAVKTSTSGYGLAVRDITMLSLAYDHRVIDGALGGSFLSRVAWFLENFNTDREG